MIWEAAFHNDPMVFDLHIVRRSPSIPKGFFLGCHKFVPQKTPISLASVESHGVVTTQCNKLRDASMENFVPGKDILALGASLHEDDERLNGTTRMPLMSSIHESGHWDASLHEYGIVQANHVAIRGLSRIEAFHARRVGSSFPGIQTIMLAPSNNEERETLGLAHSLRTKLKRAKTRGLAYTEKPLRQLHEQGVVDLDLVERLFQNGYAVRGSWNVVDVSYLKTNGFEPDNMVTPFKITARRTPDSTAPMVGGLIGVRTLLIFVRLGENAGPCNLLPPAQGVQMMQTNNEALGILGITL